MTRSHLFPTFFHRPQSAHFADFLLSFRGDKGDRTPDLVNAIFGAVSDFTIVAADLFSPVGNCASRRADLGEKS